MFCEIGLHEEKFQEKFPQELFIGFLLGLLRQSFLNKFS